MYLFLTLLNPFIPHFPYPSRILVHTMHWRLRLLRGQPIRRRKRAKTHKTNNVITLTFGPMGKKDSHTIYTGMCTHTPTHACTCKNTISSYFYENYINSGISTSLWLVKKRSTAKRVINGCNIRQKLATSLSETLKHLEKQAMMGSLTRKEVFKNMSGHCCTEKGSPE